MGSIKPSTFLLMVYVPLMVLTLECLIAVWFTNGSGDWALFWIFGGITFVICAFFCWGSSSLSRRVRRREADREAALPGSLLALRSAVVSGDDLLTPSIQISDGMELTSMEPGDAPKTLSLLPPQRSTLRVGQNLALVAIVLFTVTMVSDSYVAKPLVEGGGIEYWPLVSLLLIGPILSVCAFISMTRAASARIVQVKPDGLYWKKSRLPWSEMRGLCVLVLRRTERKVEGDPNAIYAVIGEHANLTWFVDSSRNDSIAASTALLQRIQSRTQLPLRNITPGFIRLNREVTLSSGKKRRRLLAVDDWTYDDVYMPSQFVSSLMFAVSVLMLLAGIPVPYAQQQYFGGQLTRLETSNAAMHYPLTSNDLQWQPAPQQAASAFTFTPNGYAVDTHMNPNAVLCCASSLIPQHHGQRLA